MNPALCLYCHTRPIPPLKRKYCDVHSGEASAIWKREHRRQWKALGDRYWLADWKHKSDEERRAYFRAYMRAYRLKRRAATAKRSLGVPQFALSECGANQRLLGEGGSLMS
jgi:hypothetical protein